MAGRTRNTKKLAQRIDRDYFKRVFPLTHWRRVLSIVLTAVGLLWLGWHGFARNNDAFTSGPIKSSHAAFGNNCAACHSVNAVFGRKVTDQSCKACHDGPVHHAQQTFTPRCADCHIEHQGSLELSRTGDASCTQCHANLKSKNGTLKFAASIRSFGDGHPEFAAKRPGQNDLGTLRFNHALHLKKAIRSPGGNVELKCSDCHRPIGTREPWPYGKVGEPGADGPPPETVLPRHVTQRAYMATINYQEHCSACHPIEVALGYDHSVSGILPHKKPETVRDFAVQRFTQYIAAHPIELHAPSPLPRLPTRPVPPPPRNAGEWVGQRMAEAEQLLWTKTCKECHSMNYSAGPLPVVAKAAVTRRWFKDAHFDHQFHQMLTCESCHSKAKTSSATSDILLPGIQVCQECHTPGRQVAAEARCFECHEYHDWSKEKPVTGKYGVGQLVR
ncbi:MAG: hypothetical protein M3Y27_16590 [Acidobacteriota bacterium]|nr:hypothetical protein [Acidobacteriota bacterium]